MKILKITAVVLLIVISAFATRLRAQERGTEIIEDGGTGKYSAVMVRDSTLRTHTIFRPADLTVFGKKNRLPVIAWGNGACYDSPFEHVRFLSEVASHGFLVIAIGKMPKESDVRTKSSLLIDAIDWAIAQNADKGSPYYDRIDIDAIAVSGMSCGGLQTLEVAGDPRIRTIIVCNSGIFRETRVMMPGMPSLTKDHLQSIHTPALYLLGGPSDIAYENGMDDFRKINHVPVFVANLDVGHGGTYAQPHGGEFARVAVQWYKWQLKGDKAAGKMFTGKVPGLSKSKGWTIEKKKIP